MIWHMPIYLFVCVRSVFVEYDGKFPCTSKILAPNRIRIIIILIGLFGLSSFRSARYTLGQVVRFGVMPLSVAWCIIKDRRFSRCFCCRKCSRSLPGRLRLEDDRADGRRNVAYYLPAGNPRAFSSAR